MYLPTFWGLVRPTGRAFGGVRGLWLLFLTSVPASLLGLFAHSAIKEHLFSPVTVPSPSSSALWPSCWSNGSRSGKASATWTR
jgi:undecaprenyl pyrophosphate phosphatase UppP